MDSIRMPPPGMPAHTHAPHRANPGASPPATNEKPAESVDLRASLRAALQESVAYQIIHRTFGKVNDTEEDIPPESAPVQATESRPVAAGMDVAAQALSELQQRAVNVRVLEIESNSEPQRVQKGDPLILDLDGDGFETTGVNAGVQFDLDADGSIDQTSFATGDDAFLALDRNGNGRIDDGGELFGDQLGDANGFAALRLHDLNRDGVINAQDPVFVRLQLVRADENGKLVSQRLVGAGVASISLEYRDTRHQLDLYDEITQTGTFTHADGRLGSVADVLVGFRKS